MGMTKGHSVAAIIIGTLQLLLAIALIITSFVLSSYGKAVDTSMTPYWTGFPVSMEIFQSFMRKSVASVVRGF